MNNTTRECRRYVPARPLRLDPNRIFLEGDDGFNEEMSREGYTGLHALVEQLGLEIVPVKIADDFAMRMARFTDDHGAEREGPRSDLDVPKARALLARHGSSLATIVGDLDCLGEVVPAGTLLHFNVQRVADVLSVMAGSERVENVLRLIAEEIRLRMIAPEAVEKMFPNGPLAVDPRVYPGTRECFEKARKLLWLLRQSMDA